MKYDDERVEKLPQWAKNLIADLTRAADEARSELDRRRIPDDIVRQYEDANPTKTVQS